MHAQVHFLNFTRKLAITTVLFLAPLHFLKIGFTGLQIGALVSVWAVAPLLMSFPIGRINDRVSMAGVVWTGLLTQALCLAALAFVRSFSLTAALFLIAGAANNALDVSLQSLFYKDETEMDQNRKYGLYAFWMNLGPAVGVLSGAIFVEMGGYRAMLLVFAGVSLIDFLAVRGFAGQKFHAVSMRDYGRDLLRPRTLGFVLFVFLLAVHWAVEGSVYSPFLEKNLGLAGIRTPLYIGGGLLVMAFSALYFSRAEFRPERNKRRMFLAMGASGAGLMLMTLQPAALSFGFRVVHETADGALGVLIAVFVSRLFAKKSIGGSAGMVLSVQILGQMVGGLLLTPLGFSYGLAIPFLVSGGMLIVNAAYGALVFRRVPY
jgi:DHA1 family tetracycline resistance protein-like MFS transporter